MAQARRKKQPTRHAFMLDPALTLCIGILVCLGLVMVASSSVAIAEKHQVAIYFYALKHLVAILLGLGLATMAVYVNVDHLERASPLLLPLAIVLLLLVFVTGIGTELNGSRRWIDLRFMLFQPVEAVKILFIIYLAGYLVRRHDRVTESFKGILWPCATAALLCVLLIAQPDFGGAVLIIALAIGLLWMAGARIRDLLGLGLLALPLMTLVALSESYRIRRLKSFLDPWADPYNDGFQLTQALIAIGRGEWFGVGLGGSVQKLFYLPEANTDFILSVYAEEMGFIGVVFLLGVYGLLVGRGMFVALRAIAVGKPFLGLICFGVVLMIALQTLISTGVNFGVLPTKGLTLPLMSSGGSSVMMTLLGLGLVLRCASEAREEPDPVVEGATA